jgi:hypothetical protein
VIGNNIVPICLPKDSDILNKISKKNCSAAGWGKDPNGNKICIGYKIEMLLIQ